MSPRHHHRAARHRDAGLQRIAWATRAFAAASVALIGGFVALAAHTQVGAKTPTRARVGATIPTPPPSTTAGTLPPDTFPPSNDTTPPTAAAVQPQPPETAPQQQQQPDPQIVSGAS